VRWKDGGYCVSDEVRVIYAGGDEIESTWCGAT